MFAGRARGSRGRLDEACSRRRICRLVEFALAATVLIRVALLLGAVFLASVSQARVPDDDEGVATGADLELKLPDSARLVRPIRIDIGPAEQNVFLVDASSISVGSDGVIRYIVAVVSPSGVSTISYEGIRCATRERRNYAAGRADHSWSRLRDVRWLRIEPRAINGYPNVLYREFFCPVGAIVRDAAEAVLALERGGHPSLRDTLNR